MFLHAWYHLLDEWLTPQLEEKQMVSFIRGLHLASDMQILDVGCGYGWNLRILQDIMVT